MDLQPTLLTEIFQPTRRALNLLRASTRHGAFVATAGKAMDAFCAKIVFAPEPLRDPASAGIPLELVLPPAREYAPPISASEGEHIWLRNIRLSYSFRAFARSLAQGLNQPPLRILIRPYSALIIVQCPAKRNIPSSCSTLCRSFFAPYHAMQRSRAHVDPSGLHPTAATYVFVNMIRKLRQDFRAALLRRGF